MITSETTIRNVLHSGTAEEVLALRCPLSGGPLRIEYCETRHGWHFRVSGTRSDFAMKMSGLHEKPKWLRVLGSDFVTRPTSAESGAAPNEGPTTPPGNPADTEGPRHR